MPSSLCSGAGRLHAPCRVGRAPTGGMGRLALIVPFDGGWGWLGASAPRSVAQQPQGEGMRAGGRACQPPRVRTRPSAPRGSPIARDWRAWGILRLLRWRTEGVCARGLGGGRGGARKVPFCSAGPGWGRLLCVRLCARILAGSLHSATGPTLTPLRVAFPLRLQMARPSRSRAARLRRSAWTRR